METRVRYVNRIRKASGQTYYQWKRPGHPAMMLTRYGEPRVPTSRAEEEAKELHPLFVAQVAHLNQFADRGRVDDSGSFAWLVRRFKAADDFTDLRPRTQKNYTYWLSRVKHFDKLQIAAFDHPDAGPRICRGIRDKLKAKPRVAREVLTTLSTLFKWACREQHMKTNPVALVKLPKVKKVNRAWEVGQIEHWLAHTTDPYLRAALLLGLYTDQRENDVVELTWFQYDGRVIDFTQSKTEKQVKVAVHPVLKEALDALPRHGGHVLMWQETRNGRPPLWHPYRQDHFSKAFGRATRALIAGARAAGQEKAADGLKGLTFRHLRATAQSWMSHRGVTPQKLADVTGHSIARSHRIMDQYHVPDVGDAVLLLPDVNAKRTKES